MTSWRTKSSLSILIILTLAFSLLSVAKLKGENSPDSPAEQIAFLHLKVNANGITLLDQILAEGALKRPKSVTGSFGLGVRVLDERGASLFEEVVENPLVKRYEYEDPDNPGQIKSKLVFLDEAEFWVRIPLTSGSNRIEFRQEDRRPGEELLRPDPRLTGSIALAAVRGGN